MTECTTRFRSRPKFDLLPSVGLIAPTLLVIAPTLLEAAILALRFGFDCGLRW